MPISITETPGQDTKQMKKMLQLIKELGQLSGVGRFVASNLHTLTLDRIFTRGIGGDGKKIGTYSLVTIKNKKKKGRFSSGC